MSSLTVLLQQRLDKLRLEKCEWVNRLLDETIFDEMIRAYSSFDQTWFDAQVNEGAMQVIFSSYVNEIWLGEFPPSVTVKTLEIVDSLLENQLPLVDTLLTASGIKDPVRVKLKLTNLVSTVRYLFGHNFHSAINVPLTVDLVKEVNRLIGVGLIDSAGTFREKKVTAAGSSAAYSLPQQIMLRLSTLIHFVNNKLTLYSSNTNTLERSKSTFLLGVLFFSEFLLIHPFMNGNGRTARLLVNYILRHITFVPFSLFYKSRELYIQVLEERCQPGSPMNPLAFYMLLCAKKTQEDLDNLVIDPSLLLTGS